MLCDFASILVKPVLISLQKINIQSAMLHIITNILLLAHITFGIAYILFSICKYFALLNVERYHMNAKYWRILFVIFNLLPCIDVLLLMYASLGKDFSFVSVLMSSSTLLPWKYRLAVVWSSNETSLLFWLGMISIASTYYYITCRNTSMQYELTVMLMIQALMGAMIYFTCNPFLSIASVVKEGLGMNPMLQDDGMMIHPPILYVGYAFSAVCFACIVGNEINARAGVYYSHNSTLLVSKISLCALVLAVGLGGWWAYHELGWGGYWFFDPVENISLMPTLSIIAAYHELLLNRRIINYQHISYKRTIFGTLPFLLSLYGTFFVRSGMLISIHSFAGTKSSMVILALCIAMTCMSLWCLISQIFRSNAVVIEDISIQIHTPRMVLTNYANYIWGIAIFVLLLTICYPIVYDYFYAKTIELNYEFFIDYFLPILLIVCGFLFALHLNYISTFKPENFLHMDRRHYFVSLSAICYGIMFDRIYMYQSTGRMMVLLFNIIGAGIVISNIIHLIELQKKRKNIAMIFAHTGIGILILSICINSNLSFSERIHTHTQSTEELINPYSQEKFKVAIGNMQYSASKNYARQIVPIRIFNSQQEVVTDLFPEQRYYPIEDKLSSETHISSFLFEDWAAVIEKCFENDIIIDIYYRPAITFIWLSVAMIVFGVITIKSRKAL